MQVRQAVRADVAALLALDRVAQHDEKRRRFISDAVDGERLVVAVVDDTVAGYLVLEYTFFGCGFISMLYVHSDHRRSGIGSALVRHAERLCMTPKLFTSTNESNHPMQALLETLSYVPSGVIHNLDEGDPELVYFKKL